MPFWFALLLFIGTSIVSALLQKKPPDVQAASKGDFQTPTAQDGRVIPVIFGTCKVAGPNVVDFPTYRAQAQKTSVGGFLGIGQKKVTTGYRYFCTLQMALCQGPIDALVDILVGDRSLGSNGDWTRNIFGALDQVHHTINPTLPGALPGSGGKIDYVVDWDGAFGGDQREGGIFGALSFYFGTSDQAGDPYLASLHGAAPAHHGLCYAVIKDFYVGTSNYMKPWAFALRRCPNGLGLTSNRHMIHPPPLVKAYVGTGNGTMVAVTLGSAPVTDSFTITATDATHFSVVGLVSGNIGTATVGTPFSTTKINFTINSGSIAFIAGDVFGIQTDSGIDANPACMLFDIMTNQDWGLGEPTTRFNLSSWQAAGNTLSTEGFGLSMLLDTEAAADQFIGDILRHIDGVIYTDPQTGLWELKLARADYDPATLLEITEDDIQDAPEFSRPSWVDTLNEIKIGYVDRAASYQDRVVQAQDLANFQVRGGELVTQTINFKAVSNALLAQFIATRELKTHAYPIAQLRIKVNRKAWALRPGGVFKFTFAPYGISGMVVRIADISYGALDDSNMSIEIQAVEDVFSVAFTGYVPPGDSGWVDPATPPAAPAAQKLVEAPYHLVGAFIYVMDYVTRGDQVSTKCEVWSDPGTGYHLTNVLDIFTPSGQLQVAYPANTPATDPTGFTVAVGSCDLQTLGSTDTAGLSRGDNLLQIDNEIMSWQTVTNNGDGTYTFSNILRGVMDTIPADHALGARVFFVSDGADVVDPDPYPTDLTVKVKNAPSNTLKTFAISGATELTLTTASRYAKPYPPGNVKVNSLPWPVTTVADAVLTWNHRDRLSQTTAGTVIPQDTTGSYTPEGNYTVEVWVGGVLKQSYSGLTGTSQTYTASQRVADDPDGSKTVVMKIRPINGSLEGTTRPTSAFQMSGLGMCLGQVLGGLNS